MSNFFVDNYFFLQIAVAIPVFRWLAPRLPATGKKATLLAISALFLAQLGGARTFLPWVAGFAALVTGLAYLVSRDRARHGLRWLALGGVFASLAVLILFKYPNLVGTLAPRDSRLLSLHTIKWIGLSYLSFKAIELLLAVKNGRVKVFRPLDAFLFLTYFGTFVSGPIHRFGEFVKAIDRPLDPLTPQRFRANVMRASWGVVKMLFLARWAFYNSVLAPEFPAGAATLELVLGFYCYFLFIYLDFSGYCDVAIAVSDFLGVKVPENFRAPFLARNVQDFWDRWHITLSHWCRDVIFFPVLKRSAGRFSPAAMPFVTAFGVLLVFGAIGAWHGDSLHWVYYGLFHGLGVCGVMLYRGVMNRAFPNFFETGGRHPAYVAAAVFLTFNFVALSLVFTLSPDRVQRLLGH